MNKSHAREAEHTLLSSGLQSFVPGTSFALGGELNVTGLPGFDTGVEYVWEVWVYSPDGGYGISFESRWVTFNNKVANSPALSVSQHSKADARMADLRR